MSIGSVDKMWSRETSRENSPDGKSISVAYGSAYQVTHTAGTSQDDIRYATGIPRVRDAFTPSTPVFCTDVSVDTVSPIMSIVSVAWQGELSINSDNPVNQPPTVRYYSSASNEAVDTDGNGFPLTNVIGEPVDGLNKDVNDMVLEVTRSYQSVSGKLALQYLDATNSDNFSILGDNWDPGSCALKSFEITPVYEKSYQPSYFNVHAVVECRQAFNTVPARAHWHRYRNEGMYERVGVAVSITGGGGTGAYAYAITNPAGEVVAVVVTNRGRGYTSVPTVTITGAGTGATATATGDDDGGVLSISVGAGGSGYKSKFVRATDDNKEPVARPVLLAADGTRLENAGSAIWLERPKKTYSLPFSTLGLL